jgi:predicted permease
MITEFFTRIRYLIFRRTHSELDDELQFHLEQSIAVKVAAGLPPSEARRQALVEFGGAEATREQCEEQRPGWWLGVISQDLRYALRGILAHRWFSAAIIVVLALGIGLNTMVFTLVNAVLFKPVPVPGGARLVSIANRSDTRDNLPISYPDFQAYRNEASSFESIDATVDDAGVLSEDGKAPQQYSLALASAGIFSMVQANAMLGRAFLPTDDHPGAQSVLVIGYDVWQQRYVGLRSVIGSQVRVNGQPATIIGVMPKGFRFPHNIELWIPLVPTPDLATRSNRALHVWAILKRGVTPRQASAGLNGIAKQLSNQFPADKGLGVSVLTFQQGSGEGIRMAFLLMLGAVGFVLLIACADVANMMLSRSLSRQREMSIRTALGASRWRIVRQLLIESLLLSTIGGVLGMGLAAGGVHWFDFATKAIRPWWIQFTMDFSVFGYFATVCILSGLLFGIAPALHSSEFDLIGVLKEGARSISRHRGGKLSGGLVVFQFALTMILLTCAGLFVRSFLQSLSINPFVPARQLTIANLQLPGSRYKDTEARELFFDQLLLRLRSIPGVSRTAITSDAPGLGAAGQQIELEHHLIENPAQRPWISLVAASPNYFDTISLPLMQGRYFNEVDGTAHHDVAILTRTAASRLWPGQDPIGKRFRLFEDSNKPSDWITVVGISADLVQDVQENNPKPLLFVPYRQEGSNNMVLLVESAADPLPSMRQAVESLDPELPLNDPSRLKAAIEVRAWFFRVFGRIFLAFALIAMLMASVGLYAVIAHATSMRTREIGVRIALGATMRNILLLVMRRGLSQIAVGLALGLSAALPLAHLLDSQLLGASRSDPAVLLCVAFTLASVGVFACWLPARRAAALDPVKAVRYE